MKGQVEVFIAGAALLIFAASAVWTIRPLPPVEPTASDQRNETPYVPTDRRMPTLESSTWLPPSPQSEDGQWLYDVFTPPRIFLNPETRVFTVIPYTGPVEVEPFGVVLNRVERPLYRLQLEGYIEENPADPRQSLIQLHDREAGRSRMMRIGDRSDESGFRILDFELTRVMTDQGFLESRAVAIVEDLRSGSTRRLEAGNRQYEDRARFHLQLKDDPASQFVVEEEGDQFTASGYHYRILELNSETPSVLLERVDLDSGEQRQERIRLISKDNLQSRRTTSAPGGNCPVLPTGNLPPSLYDQSA